MEALVSRRDHALVLKAAILALYSFKGPYLVWMRVSFSKMGLERKNKTRRWNLRGSGRRAPRKIGGMRAVGKAGHIEQSELILTRPP
jgi:hypothetical protein